MSYILDVMNGKIEPRPDRITLKQYVLESSYITKYLSRIVKEKSLTVYRVLFHLSYFETGKSEIIASWANLGSLIISEQGNMLTQSSVKRRSTGLLENNWITVNRQRAEFGLQKSIDPDQWDSVKGYAKGHSLESKQINSELETVKSNVFLKKREFNELGKNFTAYELKNSYLGIDENSQTILGVFKDHNNRCLELINKDFAPGTIERYNTCYKHIEDFIKLRYKTSDLNLFEITPMFINGFELYLKTKRNCNHNTTVKYIKNFKKIVRIALSNGWLKNDPFVNIKYQLDEVDLDYLSEEELTILSNKTFSIERLQLVKDIYLFCCYTGLAFIDVKNLRQSDLILKGDRVWINKKRQKTKNWCHIPLLAPASAIIEKYKEHQNCLGSDLVLPVLSNQKMNAYLKEIADLCGITKNLSTHTARHTFATTVTLANQISIEVVSKMLGHSSINMTKKYARVVDDLINRDMEKIYDKFDVVC